MSKQTKKYSFKLATIEKRPESVLRARTNLKSGLNAGGCCADDCIDHKRQCVAAGGIPIILSC